MNTRALSIPRILAAAAPGGVVAMLAGGLWAAGAGTPVIGGACVTGGVLGAAAAGAASASRQRRLANLERVVHGMLAERIDAPEVAGDSPTADRSGMGEFAALASDLDSVRERQSTRLKELAKNSRNLAALIDALDEPLLATDDHQAVLLCNTSAERLFDARPGGLVGRPVATLFTQPEVLEMHSAARNGETRRLRVRMTTAYGARTFHVSATPVPVAWGRGVFGAVLFLRDVTELEQAVAVKTDFVANASHELRTPVTAIRMAAETIADGNADEPAMLRKIALKIQANAERLEEMIRDLLDLSRLESPDVQVQSEPVDLGALCETLGGMFADACRTRRLSIAFAIEPELASPRQVRTDPKLLTVILRNLIENATKFAYEGTQVRVEAALRSGSVESPVAGARRATVRFSVRDEGLGVPLQLQERVFERYFQVDQARSGQVGLGAQRGSGLGLAIVKHAVKALGGDVGLESVWKEGTLVWFEVPVLIDEHRAVTGPMQRNTGPAR
jgi:two-component system phosphate regulon sensor histidine kinase PhoR